ncbi:Peptidase M36, fungalysin [Phaffia rhodozyma]|uniref:Extracellular metalloproteinase n=1 Tax=Phaffia rhodozyma TaxID=264483 RepID=A0A0F7SER1_PHARH|nr:Peptidase M36, fungalysin [Phaffia rhodozyma]
MLLSTLLTSSLILPLSAVAHSHSHSHANSRKTFSFGPHHSHAKFQLSASPSNGPLGGLVGRDVRSPTDVARVLLEKERGKEGVDWFLRDDSYTDRNTLITHIYARQLLHGLEVVDGDININVDASGKIISSGTSFYEGSAPTPDTLDHIKSPADIKAKAAHCATLTQTLRSTTEHFRSLLASLSPEEAEDHLVQYGHDQISFGTPDVYDDESSTKAGVVSEMGTFELDKVSQTVKELSRLYQGLCPSPIKGSLLETFHQATSFADGSIQSGAGPALLKFLALVHPDQSTIAQLHSNPSKILGSLESVFEHTLMPSGHSRTTELLSGAPGVNGPAKAWMGWIQEDGGKDVRLVWRFEVDLGSSWYEGAVEVGGDRRILTAIDWARDAPAVANKGKKGKTPAEPVVANATYNVWPWGVNDPVSGKRELVESPHDSIASPAGWHSIPLNSSPFSASTPGVINKDGWTNTTTTLGNNVFAQENWEGASNWVNNYRPLGLNGSLLFDFEYGAEEGLRPSEYIDLAVTNLFYTCNKFHDLMYRLGFDELSGNFQESNFGKGGRGGDAVIAMAQDGSGTNNANFATPPDGTHGRMRMYSWDVATPWRDGDLEAGIVIHEFAHGMSTRLTGGPANSGCLGWGEAGGMGEGWGDYLATQIRQTDATTEGKGKNTDFPMGSWAANRAGGIRNYPYSLNETVNPSTYKTLDKSGYWGVHAIGEVWAQILFVMTESLVSKHGHSKTLFPPTNTSVPNDYYVKTAEFNAQGELIKPLVPKHGNTLAVQLVVNGMKLQPCRPSFFAARDAILQADEILTGGENGCEIWSAFASRGLGPEAQIIGSTPWGGGVRNEDYDVPKGACGKSKKIN